MRFFVTFRPIALTGILLTAAIASDGSHLQAASSKKGVGESSQPNAITTIRDLNVSWYYDWTPEPVRSQGANDIQFIPMIWGPNNLNSRDLAAAKATGSDTLLGFNEPNERTQSNMTVQQALDAWPKLEALHMRLGSPAPGTGDDVKPDGWLAQFMAGAKAKGYRVDFLCLHPYQSSFDPDQATRDLVQEVTTMHDRYHLPIWVTEYAMANWKGSPETPDAATQARFATESAQALERLPFVERYAWYGDIPNQPTFSTDNTDGTPTLVGNAWKAAPNPPTTSIFSSASAPVFFDNGLALTPPMGWSSWNNYRLNITEEIIRENADAMVANGMKAAGYQYVNVDSGWFFNQRDANGNMIADKQRFPHGMKALADYIHSKGLKAGIYTDVGEKGCGEGGSSPEYYEQDARQFAEWGFDLVKVDACGAKKDLQTMRDLYGKFSAAMRKAPRPMVFSICSQGEGDPWLWGPDDGNYWRDGHDVDYYNWTNPEDNNLWEGALYEFDRASAHPEIAGPGHWNDPDMLPIGGVRQGKQPQPGGQSLTPDEEQSVMSMWSMLAAPLIAGANLNSIPKHSLELLTNHEVIAVDQDADGQQGHLVDEQGPGLQVWERPLHSTSGRRSAVLLLNRTCFEAKITYRAQHSATFSAHDVWTHKNLGSLLHTYTATLKPHQSAMLVLTWDDKLK